MLYGPTVNDLRAGVIAAAPDAVFVFDRVMADGTLCMAVDSAELRIGFEYSNGVEFVEACLFDHLAESPDEGFRWSADASNATAVSELIADLAKHL